MKHCANMPTLCSRLVSHLYPYFAGLLGCSLFGATVEPYPGPTSMYEVHKFMALDEKDVGWFVTQVGTAAASFGVTSDDVATVGKALLDTFGVSCSPPASIPASAAPALQAICIEVSFRERWKSGRNVALSLTIPSSQPVRKQQCQYARCMDQSWSLWQPCEEASVEGR